MDRTIWVDVCTPKRLALARCQFILNDTTDMNLTDHEKEPMNNMDINKVITTMKCVKDMNSLKLDHHEKSDHHDQHDNQDQKNHQHDQLAMKYVTITYIHTLSL